VAGRQSGLPGELGVGHGAHADDEDVGVDVAGRGADPHAAAAQPDPEHLLPGADVDAFVPVEAGHDVAELRTEGPVQEGGQRLQDRGPLAQPDGRGGYLAADEPAAEHRDVPGRGHPVAQRDGVLAGPQVAHAVAVEAGQDARPDSGGEQQLVVAEDRAAGQGDGPGRQVEPGGPRAEDQLDRRLLVPGGVLDRHLPRRAEQEPLGQWRTLVGHRVLGADQRERAVEALLAQFGHCGGATRPAADDHDPGPLHRPIST